MQLSDFAFELPSELIAQAPLAERSASRLLVLDPAGTAQDRSALHDQAMRDLPRWLAAGDLLVLNDTRVVAARVRGAKPTGGQVEIFLERMLPGAGDSPAAGREGVPGGIGRHALVQLRAGKAIRPGLAIRTAGGEVEVVAARDGLWEVRLPTPALEFFETWGEVPLPPYIERRPEPSDRERYQSIFARDPGAVAAPTASLHFDAPLLAALESRGVERAFVTLHVGAGTFQPVRTRDLDAHVLHAEVAAVPQSTCEAIARTRERGGRVVAVGTTVVRALESAALAGGGDVPAAWAGETRLFIRPGFRFRVVEGLLTNFHLPESTLLMLVCAFAGRERVLAAYAHAVRGRYRFFSYGDAMLIAPRRGS
ncbi:MAG TPA: tRNA preQ1(34) S-adenosylmethionine ribosyltransferase-isomerase QueA [Steroidobacteraceae bacterium]|nr:tRNA preQ1(34) S-adenosylmethionine ribosyltransferase-isomerase QueA [Steroidobacteraceae bacterium]